MWIVERVDLLSETSPLLLSYFWTEFMAANIESSPVWDIACIIHKPYANMREKAIFSDEAN